MTATNLNRPFCPSDGQSVASFGKGEGGGDVRKMDGGPGGWLGEGRGEGGGEGGMTVFGRR